MEFQRVLDSEACGAEGAKIVEEYGHMDVRTPFARTGIRFPGGEGILEIEEHRELAVLLFQCLGKVDRLSVSVQHVHRLLGDSGDVNRRCLLKFEDRNTCIDQFLKRGGNVFVLDSLMANVEYGSDMAPQCDKIGRAHV